MPPDTVRCGGVLGGELVLREAADGHHEVISNGVFLMDTRNGRSERALVTEGLRAVQGDDLHVLVAGLGVGFSLGAALTDPRVCRVTVVEVEPTIIEFVREVTGVRTGGDVDDPRVRLVEGDVHDVLQDWDLPSVDVCCLDVDNGPGWTIAPGNDRLYAAVGVSALARVLSDRGVLTVWGAHDEPTFEQRLGRHFEDVATSTYEVPRGEPDRVWLASGVRTISAR